MNLLRIYIVHVIRGLHARFWGLYLRPDVDYSTLLGKGKQAQFTPKELAVTTINLEELNHGRCKGTLAVVQEPVRSSVHAGLGLNDKNTHKNWPCEVASSR